MIKVLFIVLTALFISCGENDINKDSSFEAATVEDFDKGINDKSIEFSDLKTDKWLEDSDYYRGKIKIYLYRGGKFIYQFKGKEADRGNWSFDANAIHLDASYGWIPLQMYVYKTKNKEMGLQFVDREGLKRRSLKLLDSSKK
jgi:hypothetical protein